MILYCCHPLYLGLSQQTGQHGPHYLHIIRFIPNPLSLGLVCLLWIPVISANIESVHEGVRYFCSLCEHMALSQGQPTHHLKSDHEGIRYPCSTCEYKSTDKGKLNSHIQVKHNEGSQKFPCSQCEYEASTPASLWTHVRWHTQPYWCWSCERTWWGPRSGRPCPRRCSPASAWWPSELDEAAILIEKLFRSQFPPIPFIVLLH